MVFVHEHLVVAVSKSVERNNEKETYFSIDHGRVYHLAGYGQVQINVIVISGVPGLHIALKVSYKPVYSNSKSDDRDRRGGTDQLTLVNHGCDDEFGIPEDGAVKVVSSQFLLSW